jgi:hypothetical protein
MGNRQSPGNHYSLRSKLLPSEAMLLIGNISKPVKVPTGNLFESYLKQIEAAVAKGLVCLNVQARPQKRL